MSALGIRFVVFLVFGLPLLLRTAAGRLAPQFAAAGIEVIDLSSGRHALIAPIRRLKALLTHDAPDIVHAHHIQSVLVSRWLRRRGAGSRWR